MPSAFAHALVGASIGSAAPERKRLFGLCLALAVASAAPDLDVIGFSFGISYGHPLGHRGLTHSLPFAAVVGMLVFAFRAGEHRGKVALLFALAVASHGVLDAFTDAGLGVGFLIPFDNTRYFAPWRPLITSPLSVSAFFDGRASRILLNEAIWIGLPTLVGLIISRFVGRHKRAEPDLKRSPHES